MGRGQETKADGADRSQQHGRSSHLGLTEYGQHCTGDKQDEKTRQFSREFQPTTSFGAEVVDIGQIVVECCDENAGGRPEKQGRDEGAFDLSSLRNHYHPSGHGDWQCKSILHGVDKDVFVYASTARHVSLHYCYFLCRI